MFWTLVFQSTQDGVVTITNRVANAPTGAPPDLLSVVAVKSERPRCHSSSIFPVSQLGSMYYVDAMTTKATFDYTIRPNHFRRVSVSIVTTADWQISLMTTMCTLHMLLCMV